MAHVRIWFLALAVGAMGHLALCLSWPPQLVLEQSLPCPADREALLAALPSGLDPWQVEVPLWGSDWRPVQRTGVSVTVASVGDHAAQEVELRLDWGRGEDCRLVATWNISGVPLHLRAFGVLFGARSQMKSALTTWLEAWGQGAREAAIEGRSANPDALGHRSSAAIRRPHVEQHPS